MRVKVTTYYLQMLARPANPAAPPKAGVSVVRSQRPTVAWHRYLYDAVGRNYDWTSRRKLSNPELAAILHDPRNELHVLMVEGVPAGFAELDRRLADEIELVQFGLMPEFIGQGLGKWFLQWTVDKAWSYAPQRFWLHTCTKDHPAALPNYFRAGFVCYRETVAEQQSLRVEAVIETGIYVDDLDAAEVFYSTFLGLKVLGREEGHHVFFQVGDANVLLAFVPEATRKGEFLPPHGASGPGHFALGILQQDLEAWRQRLNGQGISLEQEVTWPRGGQSLYFRDPAGNLVELVTPGLWGLPSGA